MDETKQDDASAFQIRKMPKFMTFLVPLIWVGALVFGAMRLTPPGWFMAIKSIRLGLGFLQVLVVLAAVAALLRAYWKKKGNNDRSIEWLDFMGRIGFHCLLAYAIFVYLPSLGITKL